MMFFLLLTFSFPQEPGELKAFLQGLSSVLGQPAVGEKPAEVPVVRVGSGLLLGLVPGSWLLALVEVSDT